ncbi:MAG: ATP-binding protein [Anaerolineales bacterium]
MRIAVASGKGGTGKTTVATSLALSLMAQPEPARAASIAPLFLDCDVEAPNAHLFLKPAFERRRQVGILIPEVDEARCTHCGKCAEVCQFHAMAVLGKKTLIFPQLCHGCGSCTLICPEQAITERLEVLGTLERGSTVSGVDFARGILNVGEPMAVPIIRQLKTWASPQPGQDVIVDASPGTSCPVVEAVRGADFLLLVSEPTPFGFHDLKLAVEVARDLHIPAGVVLNRCDDRLTDGHYNQVLEAFCQEKGLPILLRLPFERGIAEGIARGKTLVEIRPEFIPSFKALFIDIGSRLVAV